MAYRVRKGTVTFKESLYKQGDVIDDDHLPDPQRVQHLCKVGILCSEEEEALPTDTITSNYGGVEQTKEAPARHTDKRWALDPDGLRGKPLEELNVMIKERDDSLPLMETEAEAIAFLSKNYKAPEE